TLASPARNTVPLNTGVLDDIDGEARPWPVNNLSDMGCDEWATGVGGGQKNALVGNEDAFIEVSPNPATDHFRVTFDSSEKQAYQLYRSDGVLVQSGSILSGEPIPVSDLSPGIHFLLLPQVPGAITRLVIAD
ncbi:MAG: T9SS type A sorting domain-containing protein, partial [Micropruina sp.]